ncbi:MAG: O-antigen ligase family protein [Ruminococcus sp.]|nr:O-antigen ligase family protein [Ruminococcus sp.]
MIQNGRITINEREAKTYITMLLIFYPVYMSSLAGFFMPNVMYMLLQMAGVGLFFLFYGKTLRISKSKVWAYGYAAIMCLFILYGYAIYPYTGLIVYCAIILLFLAGMNSDTWQRPVMNIIIVASIVYAVSTIVLIFPGTAFYSEHIASLYPNNYGGLVGCYKRGEYAGITGHYSTNAAMMVNGLIPIVSILFVKIKTKESEKLKATIVIAVLLFCVLILTGKRAHFLFVLCAVLVGWFFYQSNEKNRFLKILLIIGGLLFLGLIAYAAIPAVNNLISRFSNMSDDTSVLTRYGLWEAALKGFSERPIFGNGWTHFANSIGPSIGYTAGPVHNIYVQLLCETGVVGTAVFVSFFVFMLILTVRQVRFIAHHKREVPRNTQILLLFSLLYQTYFLIYGMTGNPLYDIYEYAVYFTACSIPMFYSGRRSLMLQKTVSR